MEVGSLSVPVRADLGPITKDLERLNRLLDSAEGQAGGVRNAMAGVQRQSSDLLAVLRPLGIVLAGVFSVNTLVRFTNTWTDLTSRVNLAAGSVEKGAAVIDQLQVIARRTYSSLEQTTEAYIRNAKTLGDLGRSTQQTLDFTEGLNNALVVSGARAERAERVQNALGKALAQGVLRGEELNTVIEAGGRVAELLAEELGTTVSGLRGVGAQGKITGDIIDRAIVGNLEKVRKEAEDMPATIGDAFQLIQNALLQSIGVFDSTNQISSTLAGTLIEVADNIKYVGGFVSENIGRITSYAAAIASLVVGWYAFNAAVLVVVSAVGLLTGGLAVLRVVLIRTGIGALIVGLGELIYLFQKLAERVGGFGNALSVIGRVGSEVFDRIKLNGEGLAVQFRGITERIKSYFLSAWAAITDGFSKTISAIASAWNSIAARLPGFAGDLTIDTSGIRGYADEVERAANFSSDLADNFSATAQQIFKDVNAPLESLRELRQLLSDESQGGRVRYQGGGVDLTGDGGPSRVSPATGDGKLTKAQREAEKLRKAYQDLLRDSQSFIEQQQIEQQAIGLTELEADKLRQTFELLNQAKRAGIKLTPEQVEQLKNLGNAMAEAADRVRKLQERYDFAKDTFKGFFGDLKTELMNGASVWDAFATAAANALQKIADKVLDLALNGIFDLLLGAFGGAFGFGGPNPFGRTTGGGFASLIGYKYENGTSFAPGGLALVGERGPELVNLPAGAEVFSNHRVISPEQASFGGGANGGESRVALDVFVRDNGKIGAIARQEAGLVVETSIREYDDKQLPKSVERVSNHQRLR